MELKLTEIITITGHAGLFTQGKRTKGGFIAIAVADGRRVIANSPKMKVNNLGDISIYIKDAEMPLLHVFKKMNAYSGAQPEAEAAIGELKDYFKAIIPDYDEKKLFPSDIKHILTWFNELKGRVDFGN